MATYRRHGETGDGAPITVYPKGLGTHAPAEVTVWLTGARLTRAR